ncbi:nucleoside deaminase [Cryobacterium sp.]|jgi:tRNA(Arg) A34 adenosine deaminase TadA|uniref:nucleoside deaminase n=1 Tax=Cryobacterium sp. TaxID=1926290 RepID=UPI00262DBCAE|nr:nucleoside deaminase [Cryobacterium sp.]MCU1447273.1 cytidine deaminase [Cryobacterium sp.]
MAAEEPADRTTVSSADVVHLGHAIEVARESRRRGNHPFGAILVAGDGTVLTAENSVVTTGDPTGHAELILVRRAGVRLSRQQLSVSTLYTSTEPCAMCSGAIYWAGIGRVVYGLPEEDLARMVPAQDGAPTMDLPCGRSSRAAAPP